MLDPAPLMALGSLAQRPSFTIRPPSSTTHRCVSSKDTSSLRRTPGHELIGCDAGHRPAAPVDGQDDLARRLVDAGDDVGHQCAQELLACAHRDAGRTPGSGEIVSETGEVWFWRRGLRCDQRLETFRCTPRRGKASSPRRARAAPRPRSPWVLPRAGARLRWRRRPGSRRRSCSGRGLARSVPDRSDTWRGRAACPHRRRRAPARSGRRSGCLRAGLFRRVRTRATSPAVGVGRERLLVPLELGPADVAVVVVADQHVPSRARSAVAVGLARPSQRPAPRSAGRAAT